MAGRDPPPRADNDEFEVRVPGKAILSGEFSCVWGHPVVLLPVPLYLTLSCRGAPGPPGMELHCEEETVVLEGEGLEFAGPTPANELLVSLAELVHSLSHKLNLSEGLRGKCWCVQAQSEIPVRMGLGSSASAIVAVTKLLLRLAGRDPATAVAFWPQMRAAEDSFHGRSSGADILAVLAGRACALRIVDGQPVNIGPEPQLAGATLLLISSGVEKSTSHSMALLRARMATDPIAVDAVEKVGALTLELMEEAAQGRFDEPFQQLIARNHRLLGELGLSHPRLDRAAEILARFGLGAKLTGGGRGGFLLALTTQKALANSATGLDQSLTAEGFSLLRFEL